MRQLIETPVFQKHGWFLNLSPTLKRCLLSIVFPVFWGVIYAETPARIYFSDNGEPASICLTCDNVTDGGEIAGDESDCPNPVFDPAPITNVTLPSGGTGNLEYIWIFTTANPGAPASQWTPILGSNSPDYDPDPINVTTYYRRCARREGCVEYVAESNIVTKEVVCCDNVTDGGTIGENKTVCGPVFDACALINLTLPSGGTGNLEYQWYTSVVGPPFDPASPDWFLIPNATGPNLNPGPIIQTTWFVRVAKRENCTDYVGVSNIVEITLLDAPELSATISSEILCFGDSTGAIDLMISGGVPPLQIEWDQGIGSVDDPQNLPAGIYSVTVTDSGGCGDSLTLELTQPDSLALGFQTTPLSCGGLSDAGIELVISGGTPAYSILWNTGDTTATLADVSAGSYIVTVTDAHGCVAVDSVTIAGLSDMVLDAQKTDASCLGKTDGTATVSVVSGGTPDFTFLWDDPAGQTTATAVNLVAGEYHVTVTDQNGCTATDTVVIEYQTTLEPGITSGGVTCLGGNDGFISIDSISGGQPAYGIQWSLPGNDDSLNLQNLSAGTYYLTITDQNGCMAFDSVQVAEGYALEVVAQAQDPACLGAVNGSAEVVAVNGGVPDYLYEWAPLGQNTSEISGLPPGNYSVVVTDANGCTGTDSVAVSMGPALEIIFDKTDESCLDAADGFASISQVVNGTAPFNYTWVTGATTASIDSLSTGVYPVLVVDSLGCIGMDSVVIAPGGVMSLGINKVDVQCGNDSNGMATVQVSGGVPDYTFLWNDPAGQMTQTAVGLSPGMYTVTLTDAVGCTAVDSVTIEASSEVLLTVESGSVTCFGGNDGSVTVTLLNGNIANYTVLWDTPHDSNLDIVENLPAGVYHVVVTDSLGCMGTDSVEVLQPDPLILTLSAADPVCAGNSDGMVAVAAIGGTAPYTYVWNTGDTTPSITGLFAGDYEVTATDQHGCTAVAAVSLTEPSPVLIDFVVTEASCAGGNDGQIVAKITGGVPDYEYQWDIPGAPDTNQVSGLSPGTYGLTVLDANGCSAEASVTVGTSSDLTLNVFGQNVTCFGKSNGIAWAEVSGGAGGYTFSWNVAGGSSTDTLYNLSAGDYSVTVTDSAGCALSASVTIAEPEILEATILTTSVLCADDNDGTAETVVTGGTPPFTYNWSNGATSANLTGLTPGNYSLTVTDANNCQVVVTAIIEYTSDLGASFTAEKTSCFGGNDGEATISGTGGTPPYTYEWNTGATTATVTGLSAGNYFVTVTDADGCHFGQMVSVPDADPVVCSASVTSPITTYGGADGAATATAVGGAGNFTYEWETGDTTQTATGLSAGTYQVTVTDANGCTCSTSVTLTNPAKLGDFVWRDDNENGIQDMGEPGIPGVTVILTGTTSSGDAVTDTTTTDANGAFFFDGLAAGNYSLQFILAANHFFSPQDMGADNALDSDANTTTGKTTTFPIADGSLNMDWDAGMIALDEKINIGNFVWEDFNRDGVQDVNETGVSGVTVRLLDMNNGGAIVQVTTTNTFGFYELTDVMPGDYQIEFLKTSLPTGFVFSLPDQIADEKLDSDPDTTSGRTPTFTVLPFKPDDFSWDAGIYEKCDNVTSGGLITGDEELCGLGADPGIITSVTLPSGGFGAMEYVWLKSNIPVFNGPGDPNWTMIPNSNSPDFDPAPISSDTYYIRCARREGCTEFIGESNIVSKLLIEYPLTNIETYPAQLCVNEGGKFVASIAGGGAIYSWDFGTDATPSTASTRTVNDVKWSTPGFKPVILTVERFGCAYSTSVLVEVLSCPGSQGLIAFEGLTATLIDNQVLVEWHSNGNDAGAIYVVEKAKKGETFVATGVVKGAPAEHNDYEFLDTAPVLGQSQYRIKRMNAGNEVLYSEIVEVVFQPATVSDIWFYPNPFKDRATLDVVKPQDKPVFVEVINTFAQVMDRFEIAPGTSKKELDLSHLPGGMYYIKIEQDGRKDYTFRVFKADR
ncbi:MAG: T9SS C-terminal target domain-containing protein [Bacteroidetes bacterium]|nr:MAG: T9SS C-terminal target domain-containing protein [Bacteroidota bacterium]